MLVPPKAISGNGCLTASCRSCDPAAHRRIFNTGIYTYLWVLNKNKKPGCKDKVMLINASEKFTPLKSKGSKRKEVDAANRMEIVKTLLAFEVMTIAPGL